MKTTIIAAMLAATALFGAQTAIAQDTAYMTQDVQNALERYAPEVDIATLDDRALRGLFSFFSQSDYDRQAISPEEMIEVMVGRRIGGHQLSDGEIPPQSEQQP